MNLLNKKPNVVSTDLQEKHFLFYGAPGTRKTSVSALFPDHIIAATEIGYKLIPGAVAENIDSWATFKAFVRELKKNEVKAAFKTVIIDTVSKLATMCEEYICLVNGVGSIRDIAWGGGWKQYKTEFSSVINSIAQNGYSIVFIDHAKIKYEEDGDTIASASTLLDNQTYPIVNQLVDFTFFLQKEQRDGSDNPKDITVYAYSMQSGVIETKSRARHLKPRFEFNFECLSSEIKNAVEKISTIDHIEVTDSYENRYEIKKEDFATLLARTLESATTLINDPAKTEATQAAILTETKGKRLSELTEEEYDIVAKIATRLEYIKEN